MKCPKHQFLSTLLLGLLLMTTHVPPPAAADPDLDEEQLLTDFTAASPDFGWYVVNDNVMGGRSEGGFSQNDGVLRFTGRTNTNGGGFSSIRTAPLQLDLSTQAGIRLRLKADGRRYTWRLTTTARWRGREVAYWADFDTQEGGWETVDVPFSSFVPRFRGYRLEGPALDIGKITGMGLMIYDNEDGPFELQLASVEAYSADSPFSLGQYRWKNRVLAVSAASIDDPLLEQQLEAVASTSEEFADRDMVLVTLLDHGSSKAASRTLTTGEIAEARAALALPSGSFALNLIGKDGSVKLSSDKAVPMNEIYGLIDTMPMRQSERRER